MEADFPVLVLPDIKPQSPVARLDREAFDQVTTTFSIEAVAPLVGMSPTFIKKVVGRSTLTAEDVLRLLDQDAYGETFVRRSQVLDYLMSSKSHDGAELAALETPSTYSLHRGNALELLSRIPDRTINCVVTSTPYWGMRIYKESHFVKWADGEECPFGHEQTPEGFVRHSTELLHALRRVLTDDSSVWWNVMDTYNTRTQIRGNAAEQLRAMQGHDKRSWHDHEARRYSAGHAYLADGEQCVIPQMIAERASRIGFLVKSVITWAKPHTTPEPQNSRVSKSLEYVIHLTKSRTPKFDRRAYKVLPVALGGRYAQRETDKLSDVWALPTSAGGDGHGAQFPLALPGRAIGITTAPGDLVLDPFVGSGSAGVAARSLGRRFMGFDVSQEYLAKAEIALERTSVLAPTEADAAWTEGLDLHVSVAPTAESQECANPACDNLTEDPDEHDGDAEGQRHPLCPECSMGLTFFGDDVNRLIGAVAYLRSQKLAPVDVASADCWPQGG